MPDASWYIAFIFAINVMKHDNTRELHWYIFTPRRLPMSLRRHRWPTAYVAVPASLHMRFSGISDRCQFTSGHWRDRWDIDERWESLGWHFSHTEFYFICLHALSCRHAERRADIVSYFRTPGLATFYRTRSVTKRSEHEMPAKYHLSTASPLTGLPRAYRLWLKGAPPTIQSIWCFVLAILYEATCLAPCWCRCSRLSKVTKLPTL